MQKSDSIKICQVHNQYRNVLLKIEDRSVAVCLSCIASHQQFFKQQNNNPICHQAVLICNKSIEYFKQWTTSVIAYLSQIKQNKDCITQLTNYKQITQPTKQDFNITQTQASRIIKMVIEQQLNIYQSNLNYVQKRKPQDLTHQLFLNDLFNMVMKNPSEIVQLLLDKFVKIVGQYCIIMRYTMPFQLHDLKFKQGVIWELNNIKQQNINKYSSHILINLTNNNLQNIPKLFDDRHNQFNQSITFQILQQSIISNEQSEQDQNIRTSQTVQKKIIVGDKISIKLSNCKQKDQNKYETPKNISTTKKYFQNQPNQQTKAHTRCKTQLSKKQRQSTVYSKGLSPLSYEETQQLYKKQQIADIGEILNKIRTQNQKLREWKLQLSLQVLKITEKISQIRNINNPQPQHQQSVQPSPTKSQSHKHQDSKQIKQILKSQYQILQIHKQLKSRINILQQKLQQIQDKNINQNNNIYNNDIIEINYQQQYHHMQKQVDQLSNLNNQFIKQLRDKTIEMEQMQKMHMQSIASLKEEITRQFMVQLDKKKQEILALTNNNEQLEKQCEKLKKQKQLYKQQYQQNVQKLCSRLQQQSKNHQQIIQNMRINQDEWKHDHILKYQQIFGQISQKIHHNQQKLDQIMKQLQQKQAQITNLQNTIHQLKIKVDNYRDTANTSQKQKQEQNYRMQLQLVQFKYGLIIEQLNSNIKQLTARIEQLHQQSHLQQQNHMENIKKIKNQSIVSQDKMMSEYQNKISCLTEQIHELDRKNNNLSIKIQQQHQQIVERTHKYQQIQSHYLQTQQALKQLNNMLKLQTDKTNQHLLQIHNLHQQIQKQNKQIFNYKLQIKQKNNNISQLMISFSQLKQQSDKKQADRFGIQRQNQQLTLQLRQNNNKMLLMNEENNKYMQQIKEMEQRIDNLQSVIYIKNSQIQEKQHILSMKRNQSEMDKKQQNTQIITNYDEQLMKQLINTQSQLKSKQLQCQKLYTLCNNFIPFLQQSKKQVFNQQLAKFGVRKNVKV